MTCGKLFLYLEMKKKKSAHELFNWYSEGQREKKNRDVCTTTALPSTGQDGAMIRLDSSS
jgi:hypothetical protein